MKIALLDGAYKNAGDFLIRDRATALIRKCIPEADLLCLKRNQIEKEIDAINDCEAIIFIGGPLVMQNVEDFVPLNVCVNKITKPMMLLGVGWYGNSGTESAINHYNFHESTFVFLNKISSCGFGIGCRDLYTYKVLRRAGITNVMVTGCPAWFDLDYIDSINLNGRDDSVHMIGVSDPALPQNDHLAHLLLLYLKDKYPEAQIKFIMHRDGRSNNIIGNIKDIEVIDISGKADGFSVYDNFDLHIGFRVHAHIYNLSHRKKSILIEEDGRGAGVNEILGLLPLKAYDERFRSQNKLIEKVFRNTSLQQNKHAIEDIDLVIDSYEKTSYQYLLNAFMLQKSYYELMVAFIRRVLK